MTQPPEDSAELTNFIVQRYHEVHRVQLPDLVVLARKVEQVHAGAPMVPAGLSLLLHKLLGELVVHMQKEEMILFPAIRHGGMPGLEHPISVMRADHEDHQADLAEIRAVTNNLALPDDACGSWRALYSGMAEFLADIEAHIALENDVLFPRFEPPA
jgi:regulator of cell morphogenesis and NO signaling